MDSNCSILCQHIFPGRDKLIEIFAAYHLYAHHWRATLVAFGVSIVAHLATFTTFLFAAYALGVHVPLLDFFAIMPVERTISALPISFAGIGLREKVLQIMLNGLCGVPEAKAILIGSLSFIIISNLLSSGRFCLPVLQTEWRSRTREVARNGRGSCHAGT